MKCNATLVTATVEPCPTRSYSECPVFHANGGHVTLHTITCMDEQDEFDLHTHHASRPVDDPDCIQWGDEAKGAKPHVEPEPPLVTDAEVEAALDALVQYAAATGPVGQNVFRGSWRVAAANAVYAAAHVRKQQEADR